MTRRRSRCMMEKNYYEMLGVEPRATATVIEKAYWHRARALHRQWGDAAATARLLDLNEAYEHLGDYRKRDAYNREHGILEDEGESPPRRGWLCRLWSR